MDAQTMLARAEQIADGVLFPAAMAVDCADRLPPEHLDLLAAEGFYGIAAPADAGGLGRDPASAAPILEALASGCVATAFVWLQHRGPLIAVADSDRPGIRDGWLGPLSTGQRRAGIALAGLRPGAAGLTVRVDGDDLVLDGTVAWVTGWDQIDVVLVGATDAAGVVHFLLVDAVASATLGAEIQDLAAVRASRTATLRFQGHRVHSQRLVGTQALDTWLRDEAPGSALNGFLALGLARRCLALLGPSEMDGHLRRCRAALLAADAGTTPAARAAASGLAYRSAAAVMVHTGSRAVLRDHHAQRLAREASFLLVFGTRPAIRDQLLADLTRM